MAMSKKHYQDIARAIHSTREMIYRDSGHDEVRNTLLADLAERLAGIFAADNPRFSPERFREACETGITRGMPR